MSSIYTPTPVAPPTSYTIPSDGDQKSAASVNVPIQALADGVKYINDGNIPSASYSWWAELDWFATQTSADWYNETSAFSGPYQNANSLAAVAVPIELPHGATLSSVEVWIDPAAHVALPATMPAFKIYRFAPDTGARTQIGSTQTDTSANTGIYDPLHRLGVASSLAHTVDRTAYRYWVEITGEQGANWVVGLRITGVKITCTIAARDPRGS